MPLRWTIDHSRKLVETVIDGKTSKDEAMRFFDDVESAGAIPYRKLFDANKASPMIDERLMAMVTERIAGYTNQGPFAVVIDGAYFDGVAKLFVLTIGAKRRARVFKTVDEACGWLDSIDLA